MWRIKLFANMSLAFSLDAQTRLPPAESCSGSATDPIETTLRGVEVVETGFANGGRGEEGNSG